VSALDVSIQSQILNLLADLREERKIAYLFIAHNLAVVEHFCDEIAVMYLGRIVEKAPARELCANPRHPYTIALLSAVPQPDPRPRGGRMVLSGEMPSPANPPGGCAFHPRCPLARKLAGEADANDTIELESAGERFRVLRKCACERPQLTVGVHAVSCWAASPHSVP
jgi:oligopeptide/dipeptide ABC transporter ATP-binding protein